MVRGVRGPLRRLGGGVLLAALLLLARARAASAELYNLDQRYGSVAFSISELGLFDADGSFSKFAGRLTINSANPVRSSIEVTIDVGSVAMASTRAVKLVLSPAYFDVREHPVIRFRSTSVRVTGPRRYLISGTLRIRGVSQPQSLIAVLTAEKKAATGPSTAYFTVSGTLHRSRFGMTANESFLGDLVHIVIRMHLALPGPVHAN